MSRALPALLLLVATGLLAPAVARAGETSILFGGGLAAAAEGPDASPFALAAPPLDGGAEPFAVRISGGTPRPSRRGRGAPADSSARPRRVQPVLDAARVRILLRSVTVPGWGQATAGHRTSATVFAIAELGVWGSFTAFKVQETLRRQSYERSARIFAGIDLRGRDEEFRRIVGSYLSSTDYDRYVVYRDAANLYYDDPARYRAYIAEHSLRGADVWAWGSVDQLREYRGLRKYTQRAALRANAALALAVANRLVSVVHATRIAGRPPGKPRSWNLECAPAGGDDPTAFDLRLRTRF